MCVTRIELWDWVVHACLVSSVVWAASSCIESFVAIPEGSFWHCSTVVLGVKAKIWTLTDWLVVAWQSKGLVLELRIKHINWNWLQDRSTFCPLGKYCKSLLCSMFNEQTCTRFTWLFVVVFRHHAQNIVKNLKVLYFWKAQGPRTSKLIFPTVKYTNTQIQLCWSARNTKHMLYF